jgi:hypothetical protein
MKIVRVRWTDAESTAKWSHIDDLEDPGITESVGFLVKETEKTMFVANSLNSALEAGDTIGIPKAWIAEIYELKDTKPKKRKEQNGKKEQDV